MFATNVSAGPSQEHTLRVSFVISIAPLFYQSPAFSRRRIGISLRLIEGGASFSRSLISWLLLRFARSLASRRERTSVRTSQIEATVSGTSREIPRCDRTLREIHSRPGLFH